MWCDEVKPCQVATGYIRLWGEEGNCQEQNLLSALESGNESNPIIDLVNSDAYYCLLILGINL
ncbi:Protein of unknown function [Gryllus bimaculatus]|nr:Protein of unknown function [Gryllus bimaculatus]